MKRQNEHNRGKTGVSGQVTPIRVAIMLPPLAHAGAVFGAFDIFKTAGLAFDRSGKIASDERLFDPVTVSTDRRSSVIWNDVQLTADATVDEIDRTDVVFLPAHGDPTIPPAPTPAPFLEFLRRQYDAGAIVASVCTGSLLMAEAGLLDGCEATTHWAYADVLKEAFPSVSVHPERTLVLSGESGRIVTAGGGALWHDLVLYLISRLVGRETAAHMAKLYLIDWHAEGQLPYASFQERLQHQDGAIQKAQTVITKNPSEPNVIAMAREAAGLSERTFERRFRAAVGVNPSRYVQEIRIEAAKEMMERETASIDDIAFRVGYADPASFRRVFSRYVGVAPSAYRKRFGPLEGTKFLH